jgi:hypothetical protein
MIESRELIGVLLLGCTAAAMIYSTMSGSLDKRVLGSMVVLFPLMAMFFKTQPSRNNLGTVIVQETKVCMTFNRAMSCSTAASYTQESRLTAISDACWAITGGASDYLACTGSSPLLVSRSARLVQRWILNAVASSQKKS